MLRTREDVLMDLQYTTDGTNYDDPLKVYFDFPLHGISESYEIISVSESGLMLRNPHCERPAGH